MWGGVCSTLASVVKHVFLCLVRRVSEILLRSHFIIQVLSPTISNGRVGRIGFDVNFLFGGGGRGYSISCMAVVICSGGGGVVDIRCDHRPLTCRVFIRPGMFGGGGRGGISVVT